MWHDGRLDAGLRYAAIAIDVKCEEEHGFCALAPFWYLGLLSKARKSEDGWRLLDSLDARTGAPAAQRTTATSHVIRGELLFAMGRVDAGLAEVEAGLRIAERCGARPLRPAGYVVMAHGALRRADMRACVRLVEKLTGEALLGYFGQAAGAWVTAQVAEARTGVGSAAGLIAGIVTNPFVLRQLLVSEPAAASWLVRAAGKLGAQDLAREATKAAGVAATENPRLSVIAAAALHAAGLLAGDPARLRLAADLYPDQWCGASAREDMAGLLAERRAERDNAIRGFESALTAYVAVGATRDASRIVNKLRDLGVRRGTIRVAERDGDLPHGLTNTEFAVAELVSQGHTNNEVGRQLFISRHTVACHLKKVYQKMNVASRVELAASWKSMRPMLGTGDRTDAGAHFAMADGALDGGASATHVGDAFGERSGQD
nr:regulatory protein, luxR family [uncultured bacterium]